MNEIFDSLKLWPWQKSIQIELSSEMFFHLLHTWDTRPNSSGLSHLNTRTTISVGRNVNRSNGVVILIMSDLCEGETEIVFWAPVVLMFLCSNSRHLHTFQRFVVSSLCYFTLSRSLASKKQSPTQFPRSVCFINHALPLKNNSKTISFLLDQKPYFCSNSSIWPSFCRFFSTEQTSIPVLQEVSFFWDEYEFLLQLNSSCVCLFFQVPEKYLCVASILDQFAQLSREQKELQNKRKFIKPIEILEKYPDWDPLSEEVPVM